MAIYVDDILISDNCLHIKNEILTKMGKSFKMQVIGDAKWILGMQVSYLQNQNIRIDQEKYLHDILQRFRMEFAKSVSTPADLTKEETSDTSVGVDHSLYLSMVGSLLYLSIITRPDIAFAVGKASRKMANPSRSDVTTVHRIFKYLKGTSDYGITYNHAGSNTIEGYSDSDWSGDKSTGRSTSGYIFTLANGGISWMSKQQSAVALSTAEAEYIAASSATQEAMYLQRLGKDLRIDMSNPITLHMDNQAAIAMSKNLMSTKRTKHINLRMYFVMQGIEDGHIIPQYISTTEMKADCLTKPVSKEILRRNLGDFLGPKI